MRHPCAGAANRSAKLTQSQAEEIRRSIGKLRDVAEKYGVSYVTVHEIRKGKKWKILNDPALPRDADHTGR
jgi:uncharacterized protein YjcR